VQSNPGILSDAHLDMGRCGQDPGFADVSIALEDAEPDEEDFPEPDDATIGGKVQNRYSLFR
jgi:hypothetical protein